VDAWRVQCSTSCTGGSSCPLAPAYTARALRTWESGVRGASCGHAACRRMRARCFVVRGSGPASTGLQGLQVRGPGLPRQLVSTLPSRAGTVDSPPDPKHEIIETSCGVLPKCAAGCAAVFCSATRATLRSWLPTPAAHLTQCAAACSPTRGGGRSSAPTHQCAYDAYARMQHTAYDS